MALANPVENFAWDPPSHAWDPLPTRGLSHAWGTPPSLTRASFFFHLPQIFSQEVKREILALSHLHHDNIVQFVGVAKGRLHKTIPNTVPMYVLMEFVSGGTLSDVIYGSKMSAEDIKRCPTLFFTRPVGRWAL